MENTGDTRKIIFSPPDITEDEIQEVAEALRSGWITTGPRTKELEKRMAQFCGTDRMACLNSATACMEMTYHLFGIGEGDEVITSAYTYTASASAAVHAGARPVLVDILGDRVFTEEKYRGFSPYELDYDAVERAITPRTKAIVPVDIGGVMCDYDRLEQIVTAHRKDFSPSDNPCQQALGRILILADSAHGFGAEREGRRSGQAADFTSFSFHAVKNLTTAEGGGVTWKPLPGIDDEEIYHRYMLLSLHGQSKDALAKTKLGAWEYDIEFPGYKCNLTDVHAAIGLVQMKRYPELLKRRREIIVRYDAGLEAINRKVSSSGMGPLTSLRHYTEKGSSSGHLYLMRIGGIDSDRRSELITAMAEKGVPTNVHYKPLPLLKAYRDRGFQITDFPEAYRYFENEITLPLHTLLRVDDVDYILEVLESVCS